MTAVQPPGDWDGLRGFPCAQALQTEAVQPPAKLAIVWPSQKCCVGCVCPLCHWVTLAEAACICLALGCSSIGRTETLLHFYVPCPYVTVFALGSAMQMSIA